MTYSWRKAREKECERFTIAFRFTADWMKTWRGFFKPIVLHSWCKTIFLIGLSESLQMEGATVVARVLKGTSRVSLLNERFLGRSLRQVIQETLPCNLSRNIVALQVAKFCCPYYHPRKQLVAQQISVFQAAATCCQKKNRVLLRATLPSFKPWRTRYES